MKPKQPFPWVALFWSGVCWAIVMIAIACNESWKKTDRVTVLQERVSPDGRFVATAFECEGGGAAGYCYANVNLRKSGVPLNQRNFLLGDKLWSGFGNFDLKWLDSQHLQVTYQGPKDPKWLKQNGTRKEECCGVKITYVQR